MAKDNQVPGNRKWRTRLILFLCVLAAQSWLYRNGPKQRFRYLVIHHSASVNDDYASIRKAHWRRGWADAAYHLILSNGAAGIPLGYLEATGRFRTLSHSVATKSKKMNLAALHLCIVGNYEKQVLSDEMAQALSHSLIEVRRNFHIEPENILLHRDCSATLCPGKNIELSQVQSLARQPAQTEAPWQKQHRRIMELPQKWMVRAFAFIDLFLITLMILAHFGMLKMRKVLPRFRQSRFQRAKAYTRNETAQTPEDEPSTLDRNSDETELFPDHTGRHL